MGCGASSDAQTRNSQNRYTEGSPSDNGVLFEKSRPPPGDSSLVEVEEFDDAETFVTDHEPEDLLHLLESRTKSLSSDGLSKASASHTSFSQGRSLTDSAGILSPQGSCYAMQLSPQSSMIGLQSPGSRSSGFAAVLSPLMPTVVPSSFQEEGGQGQGMSVNTQAAIVSFDNSLELSSPGAKHAELNPKSELPPQGDLLPASAYPKGFVRCFRYRGDGEKDVFSKSNSNNVGDDCENLEANFTRGQDSSDDGASCDEPGPTRHAVRTTFRFTKAKISAAFIEYAEEESRFVTTCFYGREDHRTSEDLLHFLKLSKQFASDSRLEEWVTRWQEDSKPPIRRSEWLKKQPRDKEQPEVVEFVEV